MHRPLWKAYLPMSVARRLVESPPGIRWHLGRLRTALLYRQTFAGIGPGSVVVSPRVLKGVDGIHLGSGCAVYGGAWLQTEAGGTLSIGDNTYVGHDVHIHAFDSIEIGRDCVIADGVFIATADHDPVSRAAVRGTGPVTIGDRVFLGQRSIVLGGVNIGAGATVGAGAVVTKDVPEGAIAVGVPARIMERTQE